MLTKSDLSQIRKVVREEVEVEVKDSTRTLESQIRVSRMQVQNDISELDDRTKNVELKLSPIEKGLKYLKKKVNKIDKTLDLVVKKYDEGDVKLEKRIEKIEDHLGFASS